ncbi:TRAPP-associated protein Tca17p [[Candida] anglica]|uniref:TRAPP-associated protein Tca17p n=1 Tax=[Candida] anglica TaxID=148631 RepID=A0ABP0EC73_9ASCO
MSTPPIENNDIKIRFISLISPNDQPLYIQSFDGSKDSANYLKYNFLSHMALDVFASPASLGLKEQIRSSEDGSLLLLIQDGVRVYGYETNTNLKIIIGLGEGEVDQEDTGEANSHSSVNRSLEEVFVQVHKCYLRVICNPFVDMTGNNDSLLSTPSFDLSIKHIVNEWN